MVQAAWILKDVSEYFERICRHGDHRAIGGGKIHLPYDDKPPLGKYTRGTDVGQGGDKAGRAVQGHP